MARKETKEGGYQRKEPGFIGKGFSLIFSVIYWLVISLAVSILIEWVGLTFFWREEGGEHSRKVLEQDYSYLNARVIDSANALVNQIGDITDTAIDFITRNDYLSGFFDRSSVLVDDAWIDEQYRPYLDSASHTIKIFFIRLAILILSLPAFLLAGFIGMTDGLAIRDLRRWCGGRESSTIYNIARKSVIRIFIVCCIFYLSVPFSVVPSYIITPFAIIFGFSVKVSFERLKKYF